MVYSLEIATMIKLGQGYLDRGSIDKAVAGWNLKPSYLKMVRDKMNRFNLYEKYEKGGTIINSKMKLIPKNKMVRKLEMLKNGGKPVKLISFAGILTTNNRPYNSEVIAYINSKLADIPITLRAAILANIIEESGGNALATGPGGFYGILQWGPDRYSAKSKDALSELDNQIQYILDTYLNLSDRVSWTHGGTGSGYNSLKDAYNDFNSVDLQRANNGFTLGYVRPAGKKQSAQNRYSIALQVYTILDDYDKYLKNLNK